VFFRGRGLGSPFAWGCVAGALAVAGTSLMIALSLALSGEAFLIAAKLVIVAHVPVMAAEAFMTGTVVAFLHRVKPDALTALPSVPAVGTTRALG
jgi:cobalt/nickel transport system permease protein